VATSEVGAEVPDLPPAVLETLWAMLPEALQNVERHAGAGSVAVTLTRVGEAVMLRVADDGAGITASDLVRPGRHGLTGMRERVEATGGAFRIVPRPGGGTVIEAVFPLTPPSVPAEDRTGRAGALPDLVTERT
jgi:signal transduction histidine kinase